MRCGLTLAGGWNWNAWSDPRIYRGILSPAIWNVAGLFQLWDGALTRINIGSFHLFHFARQVTCPGVLEHATLIPPNRWSLVSR